jgi:hypothetical protein
VAFCVDLSIIGRYLLPPTATRNKEGFSVTNDNMQNSISFKNHEYLIRIKGGYAYIYVDGKFAFRVEHPQKKITPQEYAEEFINNRYRDA